MHSRPKFKIQGFKKRLILKEKEDRNSETRNFLFNIPKPHLFLVAYSYSITQSFDIKHTLEKQLPLLAFLVPGIWTIRPTYSDGKKDGVHVLHAYSLQIFSDASAWHGKYRVPSL